MSQRGAILDRGERSDSSTGLEACLARALENVRFDAGPALSLDAIVGRSVPAAERPRRNVATERTPATLARSRARRARFWPVVLCGFISGLFGGAAVMKSPVGQKPEVQRVAKTIEAEAASLYAAAAAKAALVTR